MAIIKEIGRNPNADWIAIIFFCMALTITFVLVGLSLYNAVTSGSIQGSEVTTSTSFTKLNEQAITSVIENFSRKEEVSNKARAGYSGVTDPSI